MYSVLLITLVFFFAERGDERCLKMATEKDLINAVRDSLEADGKLGRMKAEMRTEVMKLLDGSSKNPNSNRPNPPHDIVVLNELIREYLDWIGYKYTSTVLSAECDLPKQPIERTFLVQDLGVRDSEKSKSLPLLLSIVETFKTLKNT